MTIARNTTIIDPKLDAHLLQGVAIAAGGVLCMACAAKTGRTYATGLGASTSGNCGTCGAFVSNAPRVMPTTRLDA